MGVGEGYDDDFFTPHSVDDDIGKAFDDALPEIIVDGLPALRKAHDALDASFELFDEPIAKFGINGLVVLRGLNRLNIGWR